MKYAFVALVMCGDRYIPGALALGYSMQKVKTEVDTIVMITSDVSQQARDALSKVFKRVIEVPYIEGIFHRKLSYKQEQHYGSFMTKIVTKLNVLKLVEYEKVMLMDADVIFQKNCDHLFNLQAPAGIWYFYDHASKKPSPKVREQLNNIKHGERVPRHFIEKAFESTFVVWGTTLLLKPDMNDYNNMISKVTQQGAGYRSCPSALEEQLFSEYYKTWTAIDKSYNVVPWKMDGVDDASIVHFYSSKKPWETADKRVWIPGTKYPSDEEGIYDDERIWRKMYEEYVLTA